MTTDTEILGYFWIKNFLQASSLTVTKKIYAGTRSLIYNCSTLLLLRIYQCEVFVIALTTLFSLELFCKAEILQFKNITSLLNRLKINQPFKTFLQWIIAVQQYNIIF